MDTFFVLLLLFCLIAFIVGMFKPKWVIKFGNVEKRNRKKVCLVYGIGFIISIVFVALSCDDGYNLPMDYSFKEIKAQDLASYETGITYDQLARQPEQFKNKKVCFSGDIVQIIEGKDYTEMRLSIGDVDKIAYLIVPKTLIKNRFLENDKIIIKGISTGLMSYKSTMGGKITIPCIQVGNIKIDTTNNNKEE